MEEVNHGNNPNPSRSFNRCTTSDVLRLNSALDGVANLAASLDKQIKLNENQVVKDQIQDQFNAKICRLMHLIATRVDEHSIKFKELK